jgi:hypothetical protein
MNAFFSSLYMPQSTSLPVQQQQGQQQQLPKQRDHHEEEQPIPDPHQQYALFCPLERMLTNTDTVATAMNTTVNSSQGPSDPFSSSCTGIVGIQHQKPEVGATSGNKTYTNNNGISLKSSHTSIPGIGNNEAMTLGDVDPKVVEEMLSKELANMSFADRNAINEEVHGVRSLAPDETPEMLEKSLWMFQRQLEVFQPKPAYEHAVYRMQSQWVGQDPTLKLRCLRAERFNISKAVRRFVKYLDLILDYYGSEALLRPLCMSDLGKEEMALLRSGEYQYLPFRDRSGRRVISCLGNAGMQCSLFARVSCDKARFVHDAILTVLLE